MGCGSGPRGNLRGVYVLQFITIQNGEMNESKGLATREDGQQGVAMLAPGQSQGGGAWASRGGA